MHTGISFQTDGEKNSKAYHLAFFILWERNRGDAYKVELKKSHFGKQSFIECALRYPPCQSEFAELQQAAYLGGTSLPDPEPPLGGLLRSLT